MRGQLNLIEELVNDAVSKGARVLVGGKRNTKLEPGLFFEPTLIVDVTNDMRIFYEEASTNWILPWFIPVGIKRWQTSN